MAAHALLLLLFFCEGEENGFSLAVSLPEQDDDLQLIPSSTQQDLPHQKFTDTSLSFVSIKELKSRSKDGARTLPHLFFQPNDRKLNDSDFKNNLARQIEVLKQPAATAKALTAKHGNEFSVKPNKEVEGVINNQSSEENPPQPDIHLETGVHVQPEKTRGRSKWVTESGGGQRGPDASPAEPHSRRKRSWLWNQFFVIEEYRGPEPVLIGRVSSQ